MAEAAALGTKIIAIVNPNNGPNYSDAGAKSNYDICIAYLEANNVEVIGYVHTKLGWPDPISAYREMADIKTDINKWKNEVSHDHECDDLLWNVCSWCSSCADNINSLM